MTENGFELKSFRFILKSHIKLPENNSLQELYFNDMQRKFGGEEAIKYLWFALDGISNDDLGPVLALIQSKMPEMEPEVMYKKLLVKVVCEIASDSEESRKFINHVLHTNALGDHAKPKSKYSPPEHERSNANAYAPYILKLFEVADRLEIIKYDDLSKLEKWLKSCGQMKALRMIQEGTAKIKKNPFEGYFSIIDDTLPDLVVTRQGSHQETKEGRNEAGERWCVARQNCRSFFINIFYSCYLK